MRDLLTKVSDGSKVTRTRILLCFSGILVPTFGGQIVHLFQNCLLYLALCTNVVYRGKRSIDL